MVLSLCGQHETKGIHMRRIELTANRFALVDDEDYERVNQFLWQAQVRPNNCYARRGKMIKGKRVNIWLHRFVLGITDDSIRVDHKNGNGLDCQKHNLREATKQQNALNTDVIVREDVPYRGVGKHGKRWRARTCDNGLYIHLGTYDTQEQAAQAYDDYYKTHNQDFAKLNFP